MAQSRSPAAAAPGLSAHGSVVSSQSSPEATPLSTGRHSAGGGPGARPPGGGLGRPVLGEVRVHGATPPSSGEARGFAMLSPVATPPRRRRRSGSSSSGGGSAGGSFSSDGVPYGGAVRRHRSAGHASIGSGASGGSGSGRRRRHRSRRHGSSGSSHATPLALGQRVPLFHAPVSPREAPLNGGSHPAGLLPSPLSTTATIGAASHQGQGRAPGRRRGRSLGGRSASTRRSGTDASPGGAAPSSGRHRSSTWESDIARAAELAASVSGSEGAGGDRTAQSGAVQAGPFAAPRAERVATEVMVGASTSLSKECAWFVVGVAPHWDRQTTTAVTAAWASSLKFRFAYFLIRQHVPVGAVSILVVYQLDEPTTLIAVGRVADWPVGVASRVRQGQAHVSGVVCSNVAAWAPSSPSRLLSPGGRSASGSVTTATTPGSQLLRSPSDGSAGGFSPGVPRDRSTGGRGGGYAVPPLKLSPSAAEASPVAAREAGTASRTLSLRHPPTAGVVTAEPGITVGGLGIPVATGSVPGEPGTAVGASSEGKGDDSGGLLDSPVPKPSGAEANTAGDIPTATAGAGAGAGAGTSAEAGDGAPEPPRVLRRALSIMAPVGVASALEYASCSDQNVRPTMEDAHLTIEDLEAHVKAMEAMSPTLDEGLATDPLSELMRASQGAGARGGMKTKLFAVYDGHGGRDAVDFVAEHLHVALVRSPYFPASPGEALSDAFRVTEARLLDKAVRHRWQSGTTAVVMLLQGDRVFVAHTGDTRAVLSKRGRVHEITHDHSPNNPAELRRIKREGAKVSAGYVSGLLGVARSLGDWDLSLKRKIPGVGAEPDVQDFMLQDEHEFILIACDGVWDEFSNQGAVDFVRRSLKRGETTQQAVNALVAEAKRRDSTDNISAVLLNLSKRKGFEWESGSRRSLGGSGRRWGNSRLFQRRRQRRASNTGLGVGGVAGLGLTVDSSVGIAIGLQAGGEASATSGGAPTVSDAGVVGAGAAAGTGAAPSSGVGSAGTRPHATARTPERRRGSGEPPPAASTTPSTSRRDGDGRRDAPPMGSPATVGAGAGASGHAASAARPRRPRFRLSGLTSLQKALSGDT